MVEVVGFEDDAFGNAFLVGWSVVSPFVQEGQDAIDVGLIGPRSDHDVRIAQSVLRLQFAFQRLEEGRISLIGAVGVYVYGPSIVGMIVRIVVGKIGLHRSG